MRWCARRSAAVRARPPPPLTPSPARHLALARARVAARSRPPRSSSLLVRLTAPSASSCPPSAAQAHLSAYSSLADEEQRLIASLQKWQAVQEDAFTQLDGVLTSTGSRLSSRHLDMLNWKVQHKYHAWEEESKSPRRAGCTPRVSTAAAGGMPSVRSVRSAREARVGA